MASYNRIILVGNLTRDPELSYTPANTAVCKFGMATNRKWRDKDGNEREDVCFIGCTMFGVRAEVINKYLSKGKRLLVEGRLAFDQWTDQGGQKRSKHEVIVDNFQFMDSGQRSEGGGGYDRGAERAPDRSENQGGGGGHSSGDSAPPPAYNDAPVPAGEDIPF